MLTKTSDLWTGLLRSVALLLVIGICAAVPLRPVEARVFVGVGLGFGVPVWGGYYYPPPYPYYPPPHYYYPPAAQPVPPPANQQQGAAPSSYSSPYCRDYNSLQTINGQQQNVTSTFCQQPDGSWRQVK